MGVRSFRCQFCSLKVEGPDMSGTISFVLSCWIHVTRGSLPGFVKARAFCGGRVLPSSADFTRAVTLWGQGHRVAIQSALPPSRREQVRREILTLPTKYTVSYHFMCPNVPNMLLIRYSLRPLELWWRDCGCFEHVVRRCLAGKRADDSLFSLADWLCSFQTIGLPVSPNYWLKVPPLWHFIGDRIRQWPGPHVGPDLFTNTSWPAVGFPIVINPHFNTNTISRSFPPSTRPARKETPWWPKWQYTLLWICYHNND